VKSVYDHVRRAHNPLAKRGKWSKQEDDLLINAGSGCDKDGDWDWIASIVQRATLDCHDRYRALAGRSGSKQRMPWSHEEEELLIRVMQDLLWQEGRGLASTHQGFWGQVSKRMDNKCSPKQCQNKWTDSLEPSLHSGVRACSWTEHDASVLVAKCVSLNVDEESMVLWKELGDPVWNQWSGHLLQQKWCKMKCDLKIEGSFSTKTSPSYSLLIMLTGLIFLILRFSTLRAKFRPACSHLTAPSLPGSSALLLPSLPMSCITRVTEACSTMLFYHNKSEDTMPPHRQYTHAIAYDNDTIQCIHTPTCSTQRTRLCALRRVEPAVKCVCCTVRKPGQRAVRAR
ncbi:hypothetical protein BC834DRAFT_837395, partial [Gloeopeniophorella convolvens]